jgi:hypothetical protein
MNFRLILIPFLCVVMNAYAGDLDDGIGIDTPINDDIDVDKNIQFIVRSALAKAKTGENGSQSSTCGSGNVVIGPGSKVREVINVSTNKGTTAVCK